MEEYKHQIKQLTVKLKEVKIKNKIALHIFNFKNHSAYFYTLFLLQAEARAEFAEKTVKKLQKEVDRLEGKFPRLNYKHISVICNNVHIHIINIRFSLLQRNMCSYTLTLGYNYFEKNKIIIT